MNTLSNLMPPIPPTDLSYAGDITPTLAYEWLQNEHAILIDIRTDAERTWVGLIPNTIAIAWKQSPNMTLNPQFDDELKRAMGTQRKVMLLCRSGARSIPAAQRATALGFEAYNILEGFEGALDTTSHRNTQNGWRFHGLPWIQS